MKEIIIRETEAGQRFDKFLKKLLKEAPGSFLYKMLRKKNILLNGKKASGSEKLQAGDSVRLYLSDETYEKFQGAETASCIEALPPKKLDIIYEDHELLILNKPAGMLSQKAAKDDISANEYILHYLLQSGAVTRESLKIFTPSVCNRLDRNTSGILIAGKTLAGAQKISLALRERTLRKYYLCLVKGHMKSPQRIEGYLRKNERTNQVRILEKPAQDAKPIVTEYFPVEQIGDFTFLKVHLMTGRSHQIRAHLASIGHPIVGDVKYGEKELNREFLENAGIRSQMLHSYQLILEDGNTFTAEPPETFERAAHYLNRRYQNEKRKDG